MVRREEALEYHSKGRPGKLEVVSTKPLLTQRDLSLAYSPGVAEPCRAIAEDEDKVWEYTARGNLVAVVTNGTAVLGLGNIGPLAGKPVMEGKAGLFKKFADIDVFDIELAATEVDHVCSVVKALEPTFGGINLEDIKSPECFEIEKRLREELDIPVFHDDQHGTAIISGAALLNAARLTGRKLETIKVAVAGAGASAIACAEFYVSLGVKRENIVMSDKDGVIYEGRGQLDPYKARFARPDDKLRTLADAMRGADLLLGLSVGGIVTQDMVRSMADRPVIFALANPDPEISYADARSARPDAIIATGRSDFPNQVNNVLGFPFIFRGALDVRSRGINEEMKCAAATALAELAQEPVTPSVARLYGLDSMTFGPEYLIPKPFDPRVLFRVAPAVARAAMDSGQARLQLDVDEYTERLHRRMGGAHDTIMRRMVQRARWNPRRIVFFEGEHPYVLRACRILMDENIAEPVVLGRPDEIHGKCEELKLGFPRELEIIEPATSPLFEPFVKEMFQMRARKGVTEDMARRLVGRRVYFGAMMVKDGQADGMVGGMTAEYPMTIRPALQVLGTHEDVRRAAGMYMMVLRGGVKFFADTTVNIEPDAATLADIAIQAADAAQDFEVKPRVAMISFSNFGSAPHPESMKVARAVELVREKRPDLEIDGEIQADLAADGDKLERLFPFARLTDAANVFVFSNLSAGNAAYKVLAAMGGAVAVGPILLGIRKPVTVLPRDATVENIVNMTAYTVTQAQTRG